MPTGIIERVIRKLSKDMRRKYPMYSYGKGTYGTETKIHNWGEGATLRIGAYCSIAKRVQFFLGGEHRTDWVTTFPFGEMLDSAKDIQGHPRTKGDIIIGNDVWIGYEALIMSGVTIGDGAVIGARAVVTKDVPPYSIVAGNPAKVVRRRFGEQIIERLLSIKWWGWDEERLEQAMPILLNSDIEAFLNAVEQKLI